ncbi:MAG: putative metal-dependent HD superfamily phosphohydrolase [Aureispira sp.]|jgi:predicted metal-dependent HD superfamily phosphohydrolase
MVKMIDLLVQKELNSEQEAVLCARFLELCQGLKLPDSQAKEYYQQLYDLYTDSNRHYHNLVHIFNLLNLVDTYKISIEQPLLFELAVWYHDAIYNAKAKDNELQSAILVQKLFSKYLDSRGLSYVNALIMSTEGHFPKLENQDTYLFLDFDLSILAAESSVYNLYSEAIWQEYKIAYIKVLYNMGRKKVLKNFLARDKIYFSPVFFAKYEAKARQNIRLELNGK